jgi:predicted MFS family arabinose efflux permease
VTPNRPPAPGPAADPPAALVRLFAACCGAVVANLYYVQPLVGLIAPELGLSPRSAGLVVSVTQVGYALGLLLLVPLGDILENRRNIVVATLVAAGALVLAGTSSQAAQFLAASLLIGLASVSVQMIVPLAAHLAPEASRGRVVGNVMGGLLAGILLARPAASLLAHAMGWRAVFLVAAVLMVGVAALARAIMPRRVPAHTLAYPALLRSLLHLYAHEPLLRRRALYQASLFGAFSMFWTAAPIELAQRHGFTQSGIAGFALIGAVGVLAGPLGGRLADAGHGVAATRIALLGGAASLLAGALPGGAGVVALCVTAVLLDFCVQMNLVVGQREIYTLAPEVRSRLNALYMATTFTGGAIGSAVASALLVGAGWAGVAVAGGALPLVAGLWALRRAR